MTKKEKSKHTRRKKRIKEAEREREKIQDRRQAGTIPLKSHMEGVVTRV